MTDTTLPGILLPADIHANRPAANAVSGGAIFPCTTHGKTYQTDGVATWSDWFDPAAAGVGAHAHSGADITSGTVVDARIDAAISRDSELAAHEADTTSIHGIANTANLYVAGGTDVAVADGGTGASTAAAAATNLGLGTGDSPQLTAVNIGHASDTTLSRASAGDLAVEGNALYRAGGTDVPVADGGTGASSASAARTNLGLVIGTDVQAYDADIPIVSASQPEMEAGTEVALRSMSPLRVAQAIAALAAAGGSLTVKDEGSSLATAATSLDFVGAGVTASGTGAGKTITIPGGSGGGYIDSITLDATYGTEFDEAGLPAGRTRPSGLVVGDETYQSAGGSILRVTVASTGGAADKAYYQSAAPAGDCEIVLSLSFTSTSESDMIGPGIADSSGNGVAAILYQGSLRTIAIASGHYSSLQGTLSTNNYLGWGTRIDIKLRRSGNNWYASISLDGYNFGLETGAYSSAVTAARLYYGCYWSTEAGVMCLGRNNKIA